MNKVQSYFVVIIAIVFIACTESANIDSMENLDDLAKITAVECTGGPNNYTLSVTIESPDTGCDQYADWWEVFYPDNTLIYRRILSHSHVNEQPFTRSGGPVVLVQMSSYM